MDADGDLPLSGFDMTQEETPDLNREGHRLFGLSWAGLPKKQDNPRFEETQSIHRLLRFRETKHIGMSPRSDHPPQSLARTRDQHHRGCWTQFTIQMWVESK